MIDADTLEVHNLANTLADTLLDQLSDDVTIAHPEATGLYTINPNAVEGLTELTQLFIGNVISRLINAGSERDAVMDDEDLRVAIRRQFSYWVATETTEEDS